MQNYIFRTFFALMLFLLIGCKQNNQESAPIIPAAENTIHYARGLSIVPYKGYSIVTVSNPWPKAGSAYTYILKQKDATIPDSLKQNKIINVPIKSIVVTSTTHIPSLEMLGVENSLVGFPTLDYVSSEKVRQRIDEGKVKELGSNQNMNTEVLMDLQPELIVGFGIDNNNLVFENLQRNGLQVMYNGDWNEQTPLGKAEWIKFFGALYGLEDKATEIFNTLEKDYKHTLSLAKDFTEKPTVMAGAIFENQWFLPHGNSWSSLFIADAGGDYLWKNSHGTGSLSLSFEAVLEKAAEADFWIGPSEFTTLQEMVESNPHYAQFKAYRDQHVYSFSTKKGAKGGLIFYELAPNRPDLVLKDLLKIFHPETLPGYELYFFEQLK